MAFFITGFICGAWWAMGIDEEGRRSLRKKLFELKELPLRIFV